MNTVVSRDGTHKSPAWMHPGSQALTDILPRAQPQILDGQTHMVKPEVLAPMLAEFFSRVAGGAADQSPSRR